MKKNLIIIAICSCLLILFIGIIINLKPTNQKTTTQNHTTEKPNLPTHLDNLSNPTQHSTNKPNAVESLQNTPKWQNDVLIIDENPLLNHDEKIDKLLSLLTQYQQDDVAIEGILQTLATYTPTKAILNIIPYLHSNNPRIQATAVAGLHNAMFLTEDEEKQRQSLENLDKLREQVAPAINQLYDNPNTSESVKKAILSSYALTNPSPQDSEKMLKSLLNTGTLDSNSSAYLGNILLNSETNTAKLLADIQQFSAVEQEKIVQNLGTNIVANPAVVSILSNEQKQALKSFVENNLPIDKSSENLHNIDIYRHTLEQLSQ